MFVKTGWVFWNLSRVLQPALRRLMSRSAFVRVLLLVLVIRIWLIRVFDSSCCLIRSTSVRFELPVLFSHSHVIGVQRISTASAARRFNALPTPRGQILISSYWLCTLKLISPLWKCSLPGGNALSACLCNPGCDFPSALTNTEFDPLFVVTVKRSTDSATSAHLAPSRVSFCASISAMDCIFV